MINSDLYNKPRNRVWIAEQGAEAMIIVQAVWLACSQERNGKLTKKEIAGVPLPFPVEKTRIESILNSAIQVGLLEEDAEHFFNSQILKDKKSFEEKRKNYSDARKKVKKSKELSNEDSKRILKESTQNPSEYEPVYVTDTKVLNKNNCQAVADVPKEPKVLPPKKPKPIKIKITEHVSMTAEQVSKLQAQFGSENYNKWITKLNLYKASTGKKYACDYSTILNWHNKEPLAISVANPSSKMPQHQVFKAPKEDSKVRNLVQKITQEIGK